MARSEPSFCRAAMARTASDDLVKLGRIRRERGEQTLKFASSRGRAVDGDERPAVTRRRCDLLTRGT